MVLVLSLALAYFFFHKTYISLDAVQVENLLLPDGARYSGELGNGLMHGQGKLLWPDGGRYEGEFAGGSLSGVGVFVDANGDEYRGNFIEGQLTGEGEYVANDGSIYRGEFLKDLFHGKGEYQNGDGERYTGTFHEGDLSGRGIFIGKDNKRYEGEFEHWQFHGKGVLIEKKGTYTGEFEHGYFHGKGQYHYKKDDRTVSGYWSWGNYEGKKRDGNKKRIALDVEKAIYQQTPLLQQLDAQLDTNNPDRVDLYFVGIGGYSNQDVFLKELEFIRAQMDTNFATSGRSLLLMNHRSTLTQYPLATVSSIEQSLQTVAKKMDAEKDILFVYLTSHGSENHEFSLVQKGFDLPDLTARRFSRIVRSLPVKWKIIIVSACYSGGFIPGLQDPTTLVIAAARLDRKSFGCGDDSDMTYFARAFFEQSLPNAASFEEAFALSDKLITEWEKEHGDDVKHSYPQMVIGEEIKEYLPQWWQSLPVRTESAASESLPGQSTEFK